jgi:hypothetical protein
LHSEILDIGPTGATVAAGIVQQLIAEDMEALLAKRNTA